MAKRVDFSTSSFNFLKDELNKLSKDVLKNREDALNEASDYLVNRLKAETPTKTGKTKNSWINNKKYKGVRYINNTSLNKNGIPIVNLLEFSKLHGKPFVRKTFDNSVPEIERIMNKYMEKEI